MTAWLSSRLQPNTTTNSSIGLHTPYKTIKDAIVGVKHAARWANYMFTVKDYDSDTTLITFDKGGFQGSRGSDDKKKRRVMAVIGSWKMSSTRNDKTNF